MRNSEVKDHIHSRVHGMLLEEAFERNVGPLLARTRCGGCLHRVSPGEAASRACAEAAQTNKAQHGMANCRGGAACRRAACGGAGSAWGEKGGHVLTAAPLLVYYPAKP